MATATEKLGIIVAGRGVCTDSNGKQKKINLALLFQYERTITDISVPRNKKHNLASNANKAI